MRGHSINKGNFFFFLNRKINFFFKIFFHTCKLCIVWDCLQQKIILNLTKVFVFRLFNMVAYQTECFRLEQRSVIKLLNVEKCKPYAEESEMQTEKHVLVKKKNVYK